VKSLSFLTTIQVRVLQRLSPVTGNEPGSAEVDWTLRLCSRKCRTTTRLAGRSPQRVTPLVPGSDSDGVQRLAVCFNFHHAIMSALYTISPLLRRSGTVPSWTCRACSRSQAHAIPQRSAFAGRIQGERRFATKIEAERVVVKGPVVNAAETSANSTATAARSTTSPLGGAAGPNGKSGPKSKRRRRLVIAGGVFTIGAAAITVSDDAKHAYTATKRSYRVLETLVLNIREYVAYSLYITASS
jgi:hypothetical protein